MGVLVVVVVSGLRVVSVGPGRYTKGTSIQSLIFPTINP